MFDADPRPASALGTLCALLVLPSLAPAQVFTFDLSAARLDGDDCRFAPPALSLVLAMDRTVATGITVDGQPLRMTSSASGDAPWLLTRAASGSLALTPDTVPLLTGELRLRALDCRAVLPEAGLGGQRTDGAPSPSQLDASVSALEAEAAIAEAHRKGDYRGAAMQARTAEQALLANLGPEHAATLRIRSALAWAMTYAGEPAPALELATGVWNAQIARLGPLHPDTRQTRANIAWQLFAAGRLADAIDFATGVLADFRAALGERHPAYVRLHGQLGTFYAADGQSAKARIVLERTLELQQAAGSDAAESIPVRNNLSIVFARLGLSRERLDMLQRASVDADAHFGVDHPQALGLRVNLADALLDAGELAEALRLAEQTRAGLVARLGPLHPSVALVDKLLGQIQKALGRYELALAAVESAIDIYGRSLGREHPRTIFCINDRAGLYGLLGRHAQAAAEQRLAYELAQRALGPDNLETLKYLSNLGWAALIAGDTGEALRRSVAAEQRLLALGDSGRELQVRNARIVALALAASGELRQGRARLEQAAADMDRLYGSRNTDSLIARAELGRLQLKDGDPIAARDTLRAVVDALDGIRAEGGLTAEQRAAVAQLAFDAYTMLACILIDQGDLVGGFNAIERGKARRLLDEVTARGGERDALLPAADRQQLAAARRRIAWLDEAIARERDSATQLAYESERNQRHRELAAQHAALQAANSRYARMSRVRIADPKELARSLPRSTVFVSYFADGDDLRALTVTDRGSLRAHRIGSAAAVLGRIHELRQASSRPGTDSATSETIARALGAALLAPLDAHADTRHWIVAPEGELALLPFEVIDWRGQPLAHQADVRYVPSASMLLLLTQRRAAYAREPTRKELLAVGGARYASAPDPPAFEARHAQTAASERGNGEPGAQEWANLPHSESEARSAAAMFRDVRLLLGEQASESELRRLDQTGELSRYRYLLFATHGYVDHDSPQLSAIVLSQSNLPPGSDGRVTAAEWLGYRLRSDLVVLSGCETGLGRIVRGEGVWGLPFALFVAGNTNTLVTLWPVADETTARFVRRFFARLRAGESQAAALANTKREFMRDPRLASPFFWAGFVLYGV